MFCNFFSLYKYFRNWGKINYFTSNNCLISLSDFNNLSSEVKDNTSKFLQTTNILDNILCFFDLAFGNLYTCSSNSFISNIICPSLWCWHSCPHSEFYHYQQQLPIFQTWINHPLALPATFSDSYILLTQRDPLLRPHWSPRWWSGGKSMMLWANGDWMGSGEDTCRAEQQPSKALVG